ncbi:CRISPR-associated protein, Cas6 family [Leptolyngbyaceae cyanobacterium JSC-12]|nr:CRISPR-associated protein, Cas6 family [Leptolyngbyaceae cyanobacterium JSC-12]
MPYSLVLNLLPKAPIPTSNLSGRHLHALFLELVKSVDSELAVTLHHQSSEKAFTLSPLQVDRRWGNRGSKTSLPVSAPLTLQFKHDRPISEGTPCWWRISLLDDALFGKLAHLWLNLGTQKSWHLGAADLEVVSVLGTPQASQPWVNVATYAQLYERASDCDRKIHLSFCTPTTFRISDYDCALPTRELVFKSLLKRWNYYSALPFPTTIIDSIYPSFFEIRTEIVADSRSKLIGCVGELTFQILGEVDPLTIKQINTLADFALYAGVGRKTPMGMGMARRIALSN